MKMWMNSTSRLDLNRFLVLFLPHGGFEIINSFSAVLKGLISTKDESCLEVDIQVQVPSS